MCLASFENPSVNLTNKDIALLWWAQAFNYDYIKYVEALYPDDIDAQDLVLMKSRDYWNRIYSIISEEPLPLDFISKDINFIFNNTMFKILSIIK